MSVTFKQLTDYLIETGADAVSHTKTICILWSFHVSIILHSNALASNCVQFGQWSGLVFWPTYLAEYTRDRCEQCSGSRATSGYGQINKIVPSTFFCR